MKPEMCERWEEWEEALSRLRNAEELLKDEKFQEAADQANLAFGFGFRAIKTLSEVLVLEIPDLSVIADNAFSDWCERKPEFGGKHHTPKETVEWVRKTLKRLSDELPPDTLRPVK